ncbi:MAG: hypothetical protein HC831_14030 [Chloroflexia bacterium]|nr:hypothetical protein [Chloroflexia bacterium]
MEINCIVVDDELPAIQLIEDYINRISFLKLLKSFTNGIETIPFLQSNKIDIVF